MAKGLPRSLGNGSPGQEPSPRRVRYPIKSLALSAVSVTTADGSGSAVIGDLPEGNILFLGAIGYVRFSTTDADVTSAVWEGDYALGTSPAADPTIDGAEVNILPLTAVGPAVSKVSPVTRAAGSTVAIFDNTAGDMELNLNFKIDAAHIGDSATGSFTVDGYVDLVYMVLGDD